MNSSSPQSDSRPRNHRSAGLLTPGPRFLAIYLLALPPAIAAMSSDAVTMQVSAIIALGWFALVPLALYARWAVTALSAMALVSMVATIAALPFNSGPFWANICTSALMFLATLPRPLPAARELIQLG